MVLYQTTLNIDGGEALVSFAVSPGEPETGPTYACGGTPSVPPHVEDVTVLKIDGEAPTKERANVWEAYILANHADELLAHAAEHSGGGPDPDDARDRAYDDQL